MGLEFEFEFELAVGLALALALLFLFFESSNLAETISNGIGMPRRPGTGDWTRR